MTAASATPGHHPASLHAEETALWEQYRKYQRDLLLGCFEDAAHMLRRVKDATPEDRRAVVALLWEKRCQPWKFYRDEHLVRHR